MSILIQNIIVLFVFAIAVGFLVKEFFWKPVVSNKKKSKSCDNTGCGCH